MTRAARLGLVLLAFLGAPTGAEDAACGGWGLSDVARESGIDFVHLRGGSGRKHLPETMGAGVAWLDADGDGRQDLYVVQSGPFPPDGDPAAANRLYLNRGHGRFEAATDSGAGDRGYGQGVVAADYDGDGQVDLYVCNYGPDRLYRNLGAGRFQDVSAAAGIDVDGWSSSAAFADADGDGDLDLYVTRYLDYAIDHDLFCGDPADGTRRFCDPSLFEGAADRYLRNRGDGTFEEATAEAGLSGARGKGLGVLFTDLDGDGAPDLYVANDLTANHLFRNDGGGRFEDASVFSGSAFNADGKAEAGMGLAVGDVDGDGDADLVVTNFDVETNTLYLNRGSLVFDDASAASGFGPPSFNLLGFGTVLADWNRDGLLDAYVANGHIFERPTRADLSWEQRDLLVLGRAGGRFEEARCGPAFAQAHVGRGLAAADYDRDGDVDLAVANNGGPLQLLRSDGGSGSWAGVLLEGAAPNTAAVGTRIVLRFDDGEQQRWITAGDSYQSSSERAALFGWPADQRPRALVVHWPDGHTTALDAESLLTDAYHMIRRSDDAMVPLAVATEVRPRGRGFGLWIGAGAVLAALALLLALLRRSG